MSARPGRIAADLAVDVPQPRGRATRMSPEYAAMCERVSATLARAMGA
jgi:NitT/TauT family transport system ATP-binding protein